MPEELYIETKRGRKYLGCENYPKCDFMTWDMPSDKVCPRCSVSYSKTKANTITYKCSNSECDYLEERKERKVGKATSKAKN